MTPYLFWEIYSVYKEKSYSYNFWTNRLINTKIYSNTIHTKCFRSRMGWDFEFDVQYMILYKSKNLIGKNRVKIRRKTLKSLYLWKYILEKLQILGPSSLWRMFSNGFLFETEFFKFDSVICKIVQKIPLKMALTTFTGRKLWIEK